MEADDSSLQPAGEDRSGADGPDPCALSTSKIERVRSPVSPPAWVRALICQPTTGAEKCF